MAVTYKDIGDLTEKSSVAGTEKIVVSDSNYITPRQLAGRITGFVGSNTEANATQYVVATTNLAATNSHRFVFEVIGNSYDDGGPIHSVIQAVNTPSQSAFVSGWSKAVNLGKTMTYYVANVSGYVTLYFQIIHGVSVWISCHSGSNLDNRVTSVVLQDSAPSYTWRATVTNTNLSGFLPLAGGTMTGDIIMTDGEYITASNGYAMLGLNGAGSTFYCGSGNGITSFLFRSGNVALTHRKHTAASTYTDYKIYDASNITISSSDPTSSQGENGDIWIKI
jgi:hypothetical protein